MEEKKASIEIFYEKNPLYRTMHVDGILGGLTPKNAVNLNFYATRNAIPKSVTHLISSEGKLEKNGIKSDDSKIGIVREIEVGMYLDIETAEQIYELLKKVLNK